MREVVLDTETTGLKPLGGDRIVEIGCIELVNHLVTGNRYHQYINPERDMPDGAFSVHGLSADFLSGYPKFTEIADAFLEFIGDTTLIIHNAQFDLSFINAELDRSGKSFLSMERCVDTVSMARKKFPFAQASLDALCRRFSIDNSNRELHGALLDAELLAEVYLQLIGGQQPDLILPHKSEKNVGVLTDGSLKAKRTLKPRPHNISREELVAHEKFINSLENAIWKGPIKKYGI